MSLGDLTVQLMAVAGVQGVVLGGSRARNLHTELSDYDYALYYEQSFDVRDLQDRVRSLADIDEEVTVVTPGEWGPWINGGAWLKVGGMKVDLLYREVGFVRRTALDARRGVFTSHYQVGHPSGYQSFHLLAECGAFEILADPDGTLRELQELANPYPEMLRSAIIEKFLWEADFQLGIVERTRFGSDPAFEISAMSRFVSCIIQVLYASSRIWFLNEKRSLKNLIDLGADVSLISERLVRLTGLPENALTEARLLLSDIEARAQL